MLNYTCYVPGRYPDEFESTRIIGDRQFKKAVYLFNEATEQLNGKIDYRHTYLDFSNLNVTLATQAGGSKVVKTCPAAMGFAFAAGTTDGPGAFDFKQGDDKVIRISILYDLNVLYSNLWKCMAPCVILVCCGAIQGNAFWRLVRNVLKTPDKEQSDCQSPKPILLDTGEMKRPYDWAVSHNLFRDIFRNICCKSKIEF